MATFDPKELTFEASRLLQLAANMVTVGALQGTFLGAVFGFMTYALLDKMERSSNGVYVIPALVVFLTTIFFMVNAAKQRARMLRLQAQQLLALVAVNDQAVRTQRYLERLYDEMRAR